MGALLFFVAFDYRPAGATLFRRCEVVEIKRYHSRTVVDINAPAGLHRATHLIVRSERIFYNLRNIVLRHQFELIDSGEGLGWNREYHPIILLA